MSEASPPPWHWEDHRETGTIRLMSANGDSVLRLSVSSRVGRLPSPEDGRLIAAAPELAAKLRAIAGQLFRPTEHGYQCMICDGRTMEGASEPYHNAACDLPGAFALLSAVSGVSAPRTVLDEIAEAAE